MQHSFIPISAWSLRRFNIVVWNMRPQVKNSLAWKKQLSPSLS